MSRKKLEAKDLFFRVYISAFRSGLAKAMGARRWFTLCVLATYMGPDGECYPTQRRLAEDLGVSLRTAQDFVKALTDFRFKGKPIVQKRLKLWNGNKKLIYKILPAAQVAIFGGDVEQLSAETINELLEEQVEDTLADVEPESEIHSMQPVNLNQQHEEENLMEEWTKKGWL